MNVSGFPDVFIVKFASICPVPDKLVGDIVMQVVEFPSVSVFMSSVLSSVCSVLVTPQPCFFFGKSKLYTCIFTVLVSTQNL